MRRQNSSQNISNSSILRSKSIWVLFLTFGSLVISSISCLELLIIPSTNLFRPSTQLNIPPTAPNDEPAIPSLPPEVDFSTTQQKRQQKENSESELKEIENLKNSFREFSKFLNGITVTNMDET